MMHRVELLSFLDTLLQPSAFDDYCPNGLQVEGAAEIKKIVTGGTASLALIKAAIKAKADTILVHHGILWRTESSVLTGLKFQRVKLLIEHNINLIAYHLPLDVHPIYGNNVALANQLGFEVEKQITMDKIPQLGTIGRLAKSMSGEELQAHLTKELGRAPLYVPGASKMISKIAWCTGAGQKYIMNAVDLKVDAYLTGEVSESTVHYARELGVHFYACGHHATERYGVQALGNHISAQFDVTHEYIEIDNPA